MGNTTTNSTPKISYENNSIKIELNVLFRQYYFKLSKTLNVDPYVEFLQLFCQKTFNDDLIINYVEKNKFILLNDIEYFDKIENEYYSLLMCSIIFDKEVFALYLVDYYVEKNNLKPITYQTLSNNNAKTAFNSQFVDYANGIIAETSTPITAESCPAAEEDLEIREDRRNRGK